MSFNLNYINIFWKIDYKHKFFTLKQTKGACIDFESYNKQLSQKILDNY